MNEQVHPTMRAFLNAAFQAIAPRSRIVSLPEGYFEYHRTPDHVFEFRMENGGPRVVAEKITDANGRKTWLASYDISDHWMSVYVAEIKRELGHD